MTYLPEFLTIATIHLLAVMSPGPDFAMITKNSLVHSRRAGVFSAIGLGLGIATHVVYSLIGIGFVIAQSVVLFSVIKFFGAGYLIYIGWQALKSKPQPNQNRTTATPKSISPLSAIWQGYLTNVLNPKATLFMLSLFTQVIDVHTPIWIKVGYGLEMSLVTFLWFAFVANVLSIEHIKRPFLRIQHKFEKWMGVVLIGLGLKVAFTKSS